MNIGRALPLSDSQVETFSQISDVDLAAARSLWGRAVPPKYKSLLDAQTVGEGPLSSRFVWDGVSRRYIDRGSRRYVPFMEIRDKALEPLIQSQKAALRSLGSSLQDGGRLQDWHIAMMEQVKTTQLAAALATSGGPEAMNEKDKKKTALEILLLLLLLRGFAQDVESNVTPLNGRLLLRSDLYAAAARGTFEEMRRFGMGAYFGATEEMRVLGEAEHCHSNKDLIGCVELSEQGFKRIGTLPRIGQSPCQSNCKCHFTYRYKDERGAWVYVDDSATIAKILRQFNVHAI